MTVEGPIREAGAQHEKAQGERVVVHNTPFGHPMTQRAQDVTVAVHEAKAQATPEPRRIAVDGQSAQESVDVDNAQDESRGTAA